MNFLPIINRPKKINSFTNPLNGLVYHHDQYQTLSKPKSALKTISFMSSQTEQQTAKLTHKKYSSNVKFKQQQANKSSLLLSSVTHKSVNLMKPLDTLDSQVNKYQKRSGTQFKTTRFDTYIFPDVQIIPLHLIDKYGDIGTYKLNLQLQKYFKLYFHQNIRWNSKRLNQKLQKFIPMMTKYEILDRQIQKKKWPKQFWQIKNTQELLQFIQKYQKQNTQYWNRYILILIQLYCIPDPDLRKTSLQNIILLINKQLKQRFNINMHKNNMVLLLENGIEIQQFLDIPFSTTRIYITNKTIPENQCDDYHRFLQMVKDYYEECRKKGFIGRIRNHFRKAIVPEKYDQDSVNYEVDYVEKGKARKLTFEKAMALLERKNSGSKHKYSKNLSPTLSSLRPKSRESVWKQQNIEQNQKIKSQLPEYPFHIDLKNKQIQKQFLNNFLHYNKLSKKDNISGQHQIYISLIEKHDLIISELMKSPFHAERVKAIFEYLTDQKLANDREISKQTMNWKEFVQFSVITSKDIHKLIQAPDCLQIIRNFVQNFLNMKEQDYFRQQLTSKLYHLVEGDAISLNLMQQVLWSWLSQNEFLRHGAIQRELLWIWQSRSRIFYLLIVSMILGTFKTTPLDLAYQLLV